MSTRIPVFAIAYPRWKSGAGSTRIHWLRVAPGKESPQACMAWLLPIAAVPADQISVAAGWAVTSTNTYQTLAEEKGKILDMNSQQEWSAMYY